MQKLAFNKTNQLIVHNWQELQLDIVQTDIKIRMHDKYVDVCNAIVDDLYLRNKDET
jgi:hypothetical protein